jgi:UPF0271 protein
MSSQSIDLHADLGEGAGFDLELIPIVSSINLCCGLHAGSLTASETVLKWARQERQKRPLAVGAHPGLPDRRAMGRTSHLLPPDMLGEITHYQVEILTRLAWANDIALTHLKPHGALYHLACSDSGIAGQMVRVAREFDLAVMGLPASALASACEGKARFLAEGFAERGYLADGTLIPRGQPGALLHNPAEAASQALRLARAGLQTLCIHGDSPQAVAIATTVRQALQAAGFTVAPCV